MAEARSGSGTAADRNVVILSADSLRYDRAVDPEVMPYLSALAEEGLAFTDAVSNAGFTPGSFPSMMASRYPSSIDGVGIPEASGVTTLAEELSDERYDCAVWSDNKFVGADYNYDRGYEAGRGYEDNVRDRVREHLDEDGALFEALEFGYMHVWQRLKNAVTESHYYDPAETLNDSAREWLAERDPERDSVHLWLHYMDTHHPYEPPTAWMPADLETVDDRTGADNLTRRVCRLDGEDCTDAEVRDAIRLYDAECRYLDDRIEALVGDLRREGWLTEEDLLVVTSDHGEILSEYDTWGEFGHGNYFCEACTRVPLVFTGAGLEGTVDEQVSLVDLVPTILDACSIEPTAPELLMGESMLSPDRPGETVLYDGTLEYHGARGTDHKRFNDETVGETSFRDTVYDGYDERIVDGDDEHDALAEVIEDGLRRCESLAADAHAIDPDSLQVEQHMRDLGYLE